MGDSRIDLTLAHWFRVEVLMEARRAVQAYEEAKRAPSGGAEKEWAAPGQAASGGSEGEA